MTCSPRFYAICLTPNVDYFNDFLVRYRIILYKILLSLILCYDECSNGIFQLMFHFQTYITSDNSDKFFLLVDFLYNNIQLHWWNWYFRRNDWLCSRKQCISPEFFEFECFIFYKKQRKENKFQNLRF